MLGITSRYAVPTHCLFLGHLKRSFIATETLWHEKVSSLQGKEQASQPAAT